MQLRLYRGVSRQEWEALQAKGFPARKTWCETVEEAKEYALQESHQITGEPLTPYGVISFVFYEEDLRLVSGFYQNRDRMAPCLVKRLKVVWAVEGSEKGVKQQPPKRSDLGAKTATTIPL